MKKVAIVIPTHRVIRPDEKISLNHLNKYLNKYDKYLVLPDHLDALKFKEINAKKILKYPKENFISVPTYCAMLNTKEFYLPFQNYEYILIYQLDVLVFSNQLLYWCNKGYDYIGAPFFNPIIGKLSHKIGSPVSGGNGGFSLRKISTFLKVLDIAEKQAIRYSDNPLVRKWWFFLAVLTGKSHKIWLKAFPSVYPFNEDGFWSYEAPKYYSKFKVAPLTESLKFSFEKSPRKCFKLNNYQLPFGCHAWAKYDHEFWDKYLLRD